MYACMGVRACVHAWFGLCRAAKNSDFVRVIGFFNPPLRVRTDIYAINDLFGLWTRYKIGINLNYSARHTLRMCTEHLKPTSEMISRCKNAIASLMD